MKVLLQMSLSEIGRLEIIQKTEEKRIKHHEAAEQLGLSVRQVIRLIKRYRQSGAAGLLSRHRGRASNRKHNADLKEKVMGYVQSAYADFGPTLAAEKLREIHQLSVNKETLRQWMIEAGLWQGKQRKALVTHQLRTRRSCLGELVQIDGSPHDWFEGRAPTCCLLVFIDDATGKLLQLRFEAQETTWGYLNATRDYIEVKGRPVSFYSDRHSIFRINTPEAQKGTGETQFGRVLRELDIELICANSPQAKGRVERANKTLQDRLVKALRLEGISDMATANQFLPSFLEDYNKRFAVEPSNSTDAHRQSLPGKEQLDQLFTLQEQRTLSKNLELSYKNIIYQIQVAGLGYGLRHAKVTVCEDQQKQVSLLYKGRLLAYTTWDKGNQAARIVSSKTVNDVMDKHLKIAEAPRRSKPAANHPWRNYPGKLKKTQERRVA